MTMSTDWQTEIHDTEIFLIYKGAQAGVLFPQPEFPVAKIQGMIAALNGHDGAWRATTVDEALARANAQYPDHPLAVLGREIGKLRDEASRSLYAEEHACAMREQQELHAQQLGQYITENEGLRAEIERLTITLDAINPRHV